MNDGERSGIHEGSRKRIEATDDGFLEIHQYSDHCLNWAIRQEGNSNIPE